MKRLALGALATLALVALLAWVEREPIAVTIARRVAAQRLVADAMNTLPDGLHVALCGAGSPFPDERRSGPCTLVVAGPRLIMIDAGSGSTRTIGRMGFAHGRIDALLLTHFHSDHIDGLGELLLQRWVARGGAEPLPVHGPPGVEAIVGGLAQVYAADRGYRVAHHGEAVLPPSGAGGVARPFTLDAQGRATVWRDGDLEVVAFAVDHAPVHPAVGYRIRYKDRTVIVSGDTKASPAVRREAEGADLLLHEALSPRLAGMLSDTAGAAHLPRYRKIFDDIVGYHTTPEEAAAIARDARVGMLLLNHIAPPLPRLPGIESVFLGRAHEVYDGPLRIGLDGDLVSLPAGTTAITLSRLF